VVLIAGLFRALVRRARQECAQSAPLPEVRHELLRAATWRAARSGLEGDLVNPAGSALMSPVLLIGQLVDSLRPHLEALGDFEQVLELSQMALGRGSAAARQRRRFGLRGELTDVVDGLLAATHGNNLPFDKAPSIVRAPQLLDDYKVAGFDEAVSEEGNVLPQYGWMFRTLSRMGINGMKAAEKALHTEQRARGVTFRVGDEPERLFPLDLLPRIITADDWAGSPRGSPSASARSRRSCATSTPTGASSADGRRPRLGRRRRPGPHPPRANSCRKTRCGSPWPESTSCATGRTTGWSSRTTCVSRPAWRTRS
jgi:carboxylate-amine ligase